MKIYYLELRLKNGEKFPIILNNKDNLSITVGCVKKRLPHIIMDAYGIDLPKQREEQIDALNTLLSDTRDENHLYSFKTASNIKHKIIDINDIEENLELAPLRKIPHLFKQN